MVQFIPARNDWADAFGQIGKGLSEGFTNRSDQNAMQKALVELGPNAAARDVLNAITNVKTYNPGIKQEMLKNYLGVENFELLKEKHNLEKLRKQEQIKQEQNDAATLINESKLPEDKKQEYLDRLQKGELSFKAIKELTKPEKPNEFQKKLAGKNVELYTKAVEDLPKAQRTLQDLSKLRDLKTKLAGPTGYFKAINPFNEDAAEMKALGFGILDTVVKMFNPVGPIAQKKLEQLSKIYSISPLDSSAVIEGKIKALESYAERTKQIAQQRIDLFNKFDGMPPLDQIALLDQKGNSVIDEMIEKGKESTEKKTYYSAANGKKLKELPEEQIQELLQKGLITDVKPN